MPLQGQHSKQVRLVVGALWIVAVSLWAGSAWSHTIAGSNAVFVQGIDGPAIAAFLYLGAKHMVTGYDHLLFLFGVLFYLARPLQVVQYVTLFALGHSLTLLAGVLLNLQINAALIDAVIGFSVVYKGFENIGGFRSLNLPMPDPRAAVFVFGLFHGLGLATRLQAFDLSPNGLLSNLISFNVGIEIGQILALAGVFLVLSVWRQSPGFQRHAFITNTLLMGGGFLLVGYHISAWLSGTGA
jgi:hypothetical protein